MLPREADFRLHCLILTLQEMRGDLVALEWHPLVSTALRQRIHLLAGKSMEAGFDAARVRSLHASDADALRNLYSLSTTAVDFVRTGGALGDPTDPMADMQQLIQSLFPGDVLEP